MKRPIWGLIMGVLLIGDSGVLLAQNASVASRQSMPPQEDEGVQPAAESPQPKRSCPELARSTFIRFLMVLRPPPSLENVSVSQPPYPRSQHFSLPPRGDSTSGSSIQETPNGLAGPSAQRPGAMGGRPPYAPNVSGGQPSPYYFPPPRRVPPPIGEPAPLGPYASGACGPAYQPGLLTPLFRLAYCYPPRCASPPMCTSSSCSHGEPSFARGEAVARQKTTISSSTRHRGYYGDLYLWAIIQPR